VPPDPHNLDGDANGIGCEAPSRSAPPGSSSNSSTGPFIEHTGRLPGNGTGIQNNNTSVIPAVTTGATIPPVTKSDSLITATINGTRFTHNQTIAINGTVGGGGGQAVPPGGSSGKLYVDLRDPHNQTVMYDATNMTTVGNTKAPFSYKFVAGDGLDSNSLGRKVVKPMNVSGLNYTLAVGYRIPQTSSPSEVEFTFAYDHDGGGGGGGLLGGEEPTIVASRSAGNNTTTTTTAQEPIIPPRPVLDQPEEEDDGNDDDNDGGDDGSDDNNDDDSSDDNDDNDNNDDNNDDNDNEDDNDNSDDGDGNGGDGDGDNGNGGGDEEDSEEDGDDADGEGGSTDNTDDNSSTDDQEEEEEDNTDDTTEEEEEDDSSGEVLTILKEVLRENRDVLHQKPPRWD
jgi:hypothetical protein